MVSLFGRAFLQTAVLSVILINVVLSQDSSHVVSRNILYLELAGAGGYGSVNYEVDLFLKKYFKVGLRGGISTCHLRDYTNTFNPDVIVPLSIVFLYGNNHNLELGAGQTISSIPSFNQVDFYPKRKTNLSTTATVGYRYQKKNGGFMYRVSFTPILDNNKILRKWIGLSVGYVFR